MAKATLAATPSGNRLEGASSDDFATAAAAFKEDGRSGRHDPGWQAEAGLAHRTRLEGAFEEFDAATFEKDFAEENHEVSDDGEEDKKDSGRRNGEKKRDRRDESDDDGPGASHGISFAPLPSSHKAHCGYSKGKKGSTSSKHGDGDGNSATSSSGRTKNSKKLRTESEFTSLESLPWKPRFPPPGAPSP